MRQPVIFLIAALVLVAAAPSPGAGGSPESNGNALSHAEPVPAAASRPWLPRLARLLVTLVLAIVLAGAGILLFEDRFLYFPTRAPVAGWRPGAWGAEECTFRTEDGLSLHALWHPGKGAGKRPPVVLFCHGNAGNLTHRAENVALLAERGLDVLVFDYRGYGRSEGRPSEQGLYRDAEAAWRYLVVERGIEPGRIVIFGRSLGAAVALRTALERPAAGLIMEGAFESVPAMARHKLPFLPLWFLARNKFDNIRRVAALRVPLLMLHGEKDEMIPLRQARAVYEAAPEPKAFHMIQGASHNDTYVVGGEGYFTIFADFCRRCVNSEGEAQQL